MSERVGIAVRGRAKLYLRARRVVQMIFLILMGTVLTTTFLGVTSYWAIILLIIIPIILLVPLGRIFCGWICVVGTLSDYVGISFRKIRKSQEPKYFKSARFWCRRICPVGLLLSLSNKTGFLKVAKDIDKCTPMMCPVDNACTKNCPMGADVLDKGFSDPSCIRCNTCIDSCEVGAIRPTCYFSRGMERTCVVFGTTMELLPSPLGSVYLYLRLKILGFRGIKKYGSKIFLCTQCNKCNLASLRRALAKSSVEHGAEPKNLTMLRNSIMKYGSPYGKPEFRFALLPKTYTNTSSTVFFAGCTSCYRTPELLISALAMLEASKIEFSIIPDEICCGYPLYASGYVKEGKELAQRNIEILKARGVKEIITLCPSCLIAFKEFYRRDFPDFDIEVKHVLEVLKPEIAVSGLSLTVHDPCHVDPKVVEIASKALKGSKVWKSSKPCCGASLLSHHPETGAEIAQQIISAKKGLYVTTYCPSCYLTLSHVEPDKVIDLYTLLRAQSKDDIKRLKEWTKSLPALARSQRLAPRSVSTSPETDSLSKN